MTKLTRLDLDHNHLTELPQNIEQLSALEELWIDDNRLTTLPSGLKNIRNLQMVSADGNPLRLSEEFVREWAETSEIGQHLRDFLDAV
jgi:Leucine-rich repeat (LRR) protein